jgi:hypothetical protein
MSASPIPIFDPQGTLRDVPSDQLVAAVKAGGMPAVKFIAPDKSIRFVPASRIQEAAAAGGTIQPYEDQDVKHPGFWSTLWGDLSSMVPHAVDLTQPTNRFASNEHSQQKFKAEDASRKEAGYSLPYRATAPVAEALGVNVPGMEQSAKEGDEAGVYGHAAAVPTVMAATAGISKGAGVLSDTEAFARVRQTLENVTPKQAAQAVGAIPGLTHASPTGAYFGAKGAGSMIESILGDRANLPMRAAPKNPGAPLPAAPSAELVQGNSLLHPGAAPAPEPASALERIPVPGKAGSMVDSVAAPAPAPTAEGAPLPASQANIPRTLSGEKVDARTLNGESALRDVLSRQDNANLMKIARSRGINITQEAQLKPSVADPRLINKIADDFEADELDSFHATYLENTRMPRHSFGDIGEEANKTLAMQTFFPEVKIPLAVQLRTRAAIEKAAAGNPQFSTVGDVTKAIKEATKPAAEPKSAAIAPAPTEDLTAILQESLKRARQKQVPAP